MPADVLTDAAAMCALLLAAAISQAANPFVEEMRATAAHIATRGKVNSVAVLFAASFDPLSGRRFADKHQYSSCDCNPCMSDDHSSMLSTFKLK
jgi:hypothetical protein